MFIHQHQANAVKEIVANSIVSEQIAGILTSLSANSDADTERRIKETMRENPGDSARHLIYADWLEGRGRDTEAHLHRLIGHDPDMLEHLSEPVRPSRNPGLHFSSAAGGYRRATPEQATRYVYGSHPFTYGYPGTDSGVKARHHLIEATNHAEAGNSKEAAEHHYQAAIHHLLAAKELDDKTSNTPAHEYHRIDRTREEANYHRAAARSNMIAAGVHKGEYDD